MLYRLSLDNQQHLVESQLRRLESNTTSLAGFLR